MAGRPARSWRPSPTDALLAAVVTALFALPYVALRGQNPARYLVADLAIVALIAWRFRGDAWRRRVGLAIPPVQALAALFVLGAGWLATRAVISQISLLHGIEIVGPRPIFSLSQVLHQEIVLRGLLLGGLAAWFPMRFPLALAGAVIFTAIHPLLYCWTSGLTLPLTTVATLFGFGLATNLLFLQFGHIGFSFAAHAAWNLARFGGQYFIEGARLSEAQSFVEIEGTLPALGASVALLACVLLANPLLDQNLRN